MNIITSLPQTFRVCPSDFAATGFYMLVVPDPAEGETYRDFFMVDSSTASVVHCFGLCVGSDEEAAHIACANFPEYFPVDAE